MLIRRDTVKGQLYPLDSYTPPTCSKMLQLMMNSTATSEIFQKV